MLQSVEWDQFILRREAEIIPIVLRELGWTLHLKTELRRMGICNRLLIVLNLIELILKDPRQVLLMEILIVD